jgi:transcriptional regulator with XRE-family HTH domain
MEVNKSIGQIIRELREKKELLVRQVAALLEIDPSLLSKIERGDKRPTREQVKLLARILDIDENQLMISYLSDRLVYEVRGEDLAIEAMKVAEQKIEYLKKSNTAL